MADKSSTTSVACKLPNGLTITHKDKTVTLKGANDTGNRFGFGVTDGVDADWFKDWIATDGADFPPVVNGSIFEHGRNTADAAKERQRDPAVQTGQEPLNPENPSLGVEPTEETRKALASGDVNRSELASVPKV